MNKLRHDLLERRLWPVVLVLVVAIAAVPLLLRRHADASADTLPAAPAAASASTATHVNRHLAASTRRHLMQSKVLRDPFAAGASRLSTQPTYVKQTVSPSSDGSASAATTTSATSTAAMVSPTPASTASRSDGQAPDASPTAAGLGGSSTTSSTSGETATTDAASGTTSSTTTPTTGTSTPTTPGTAPVQAHAWTIYSVDVKLARAGQAATARTDIPRLAPLPNAAWPKVMFMGVMAGGRQAVFALGAGVQARGPALCRPDHDRCSAIALAAGKVEQLLVPTEDGGTRTLDLEVTRIARHITRSETAALAAYRRHSATGLCELDLADPVGYDAQTGALSSVIDPSCRRSSSTVPFPGTLG